MLVSIIAEFKCDMCGEAFSTELDPAYKAPRGWSTFEVAENAIRGAGFCSVWKSRHYCETCTSKVKPVFER